MEFEKRCKRCRIVIPRSQEICSRCETLQRDYDKNKHVLKLKFLGDPKLSWENKE